MIEKTMQVLGERVHMLRRRQGMTQLSFGAAIEASPTTVSNIEQGKLGGIHLDHLLRMADVLGVSIDYLVGRSDFEGHALPEDTLRRLSEALGVSADYLLGLSDKKGERNG